MDDVNISPLKPLYFVSSLAPLADNGKNRNKGHLFLHLAAE
jgi:hypothetical protein